MDDLLEGLKHEALLDSPGAFTIDFFKARDKMGRQLLPDPRMYILPLVQFAVCCGASKVKVAANFQGLQLRCGGLPPSLEQLDNLGDYLIGEGDSPAAHYLARALHSAMSLEPRHVRVLTWDRERGAELVLAQAGEPALRPLDERPFHDSARGTLISILHKPLWFFQQPPELEWLRKHCGAAPCDVTVNGEQLSPAFGASRHLNSGRLYLPFQYVAASSLDGGAAVHRCERAHHVFQVQEHAGQEPAAELFRLNPGNSSWGARLLRMGNAWALREERHHPPAERPLLRAAIGVRADLHHQATLRFVKHGIMLNPIPLTGLPPGIEALSVATGLKTDATGLNVVNDAARETRLQEIGTAAQETWRFFLSFAGAKSYKAAVARVISEAR